MRKPFLKGVDILNALIVAHTKTDIQQLKVIIAGDAARRWTEVQTMIELKPCPFCGGKARLLAGNGVRVLCTKCGATTRILVDIERVETNAVENVIKSWNRRKNNFEVIDDTPNIAEVVEKYGEDVKPDPVNHPAHYTSGSIECIDAMQAAFGVEAVKDFCLCNAFKYLWRHRNKNGVEDLKKCRWYLNRLIEEVKE